MPNIIRAKCVILGDSVVGKSALVSMFQSDGSLYPKGYSLTTGVELSQKSIKVPDTNDTVELYIHDTSGRELYDEIIEKVCDYPSVFCLVFDVTNPNSLQNCEKWLNKIKSVMFEGSCVGVLVGNKTDLVERRMVSTKEAQEFANKYSLQYFESSAKEMKGVEEPFFYLANEWHKIYTDKSASFATLT